MVDDSLLELHGDTNNAVFKDAIIAWDLGGHSL